MELGTPIAIGNTAKIYLHENKIYKLFNDYLPNTESSYEANKQGYAYSCGLSVPKVIDVTKINGKQTIIMEYIKGRLLGVLIKNDVKHAKEYISVFVDVQQNIHQIIADDLEPMSKKLRRQIRSAHHLDERLKTALLQKLDSISFANRLCHGDYHPFNIIVGDHKNRVIDWVDASSGDMRADVYRTYLLCCQFSTELAEMYVHFYCEQSGWSECDIFQWAPIIAAARLSEIVSSEKSGRLIDIINHDYPL
ncbi:aminoglycoside phosphotransferase family protein [Sporolactobacillus shoreicorticis]|uniref:Aminoglycoside phosphotransferase family protein n=1 Tax=Sporolactobacillus shoreicorticis TaxID=1923877 RepID=A0ABW5S304_9BACL|nr:aminoglycoside phosphotransferase family protein [Sporolactobacillus shoreicorticis]MCO7125376.1 aminoglycoside phosphotransferase family protein [Sporolactobacillus shoreicorticis]